MTPQEFIHFLDGFLSYNPHLTELNEEQTRRIRDKLSTVFNKVTPNLSKPTNFIDIGTTCVINPNFVGITC